MIPPAPNPTQDFYGLIQKAFDHFNQSLFASTLSRCLITTQREKNVMGYFSEERWVNTSGRKTHEIALNPAYFGNHKVIEVLQTLVHEQCHLWQFEHGTPSRSGYHNKEWARKMEDIGLIPSHTGFEGGKKTGQKMSDYPAPGGLFLSECEALIQDGFEIPWVDRYTATGNCSQIREFPIPDTEQGTDTTTPSAQDVLMTSIAELMPEMVDTEPLAMAAKAKQKIKYHCTSCGMNVWGKHGLNITCTDCQVRLTPPADNP